MRGRRTFTVGACDGSSFEGLGAVRAVVAEGLPSGILEGVDGADLTRQGGQIVEGARRTVRCTQHKQQPRVMSGINITACIVILYI